MKKLIAILLAASIPASDSSPALAASDDQRDHEVAREALRRGEILPLTHILPIVQQRVPGQIVKIELDDDDNNDDDEDDGARERRFEYEVKVLTPGGRVIEVEVDARTGRILEVEED